MFFGITAYYSCRSHADTLKGSLRRAWLLERRLPVYSLALGGLSLLAWDREWAPTPMT